MLHEFETYLIARGYSYRTISNYTYIVGCFLDYAEPAGRSCSPKWAQAHIKAKRLYNGAGRGYLAQMRAALVAWFRFVGVSDSYLIQHLPPILPAHNLRSIPTREEVRAMLSHPAPLPLTSLIQLCAGAGLRPSEALSLKWEDIDHVQKVAIVRTAKGNKPRYVPISDSLAASAFTRKQRGKGHIHICAYDNHSRMTLRRAQEEFQYMRTSLGISQDITLHSLRHYFATAMLAQGVDVITLKNILGHSHISTTELYLHIGEHYHRNLPSAY